MTGFSADGFVMSTPQGYSVGWICGITTDYVSAQTLLDEVHDRPEYIAPDDHNDYTLGKIGKHNVVLAVLPMGEYGASSAAKVAKYLMLSFPNIRVGLSVGIGGGAPSKRNDIRLGDVVVSIPYNGQGSVLQYDPCKPIESQSFPTILDRPPLILRTAVNGLQAEYETKGRQFEKTINKALEEEPRLRRRFKRPDPISDKLYCSDFTSPADMGSTCTLLSEDDSFRQVSRPVRSHQDSNNPVVHYGLILSGNHLMKDALLRNKLAAERGVLCFEMEAAGLIQNFPCLVIRGICNYADTHQSKEWQGYASMVAAAYAKDLLSRIAPQRMESETKAKDILIGSDHDTNATFGKKNSGLQIGVNYGPINGVNFGAQ